MTLKLNLYLFMFIRNKRSHRQRDEWLRNGYLSVWQLLVDDLGDPDRKAIATTLGIGFLGGENEKEIHLN